jgi:branched-subunit amino acid ABC-type transport system permease component
MTFETEHWENAQLGQWLRGRRNRTFCGARGVRFASTNRGAWGLRAIIGGSYVTYTMRPGHDIHILAMFLSGVQLIIIGICAAVLMLIHWLLEYARLSKAMRATSANRNLVRNSGVKTQFIISMI